MEGTTDLANEMMNSAEKPFACVEKGCEMTFANEDHLNWHQKKHDMMLNLGLTKNNDVVADQTPTPTRFIRNCEEVGLFQDLQNVNPFDEFFKKAVEVAKNGGTLEVPVNNSDDTLHTPHILPHIEENRKKIIRTNTSQDDNNSHSNDFSLNVIMIPADTEKGQEKSNNTPKPNSPIIVVDDESDGQQDIKKKIKEAIQNKEKQKITNTTSKSTISVVPIQILSASKDTRCGNVENRKNSTEKCDGTDETREKIREMNRAAQIRCRKRKQKRWQEMEEELFLYKTDNKRLRMENFHLRQELQRLKGSVADVSKDPVQGTIIGTLIPVVNQAELLEKGTSSVLQKKINSPIYPKPTNENNVPHVVSPLVIQLTVPVAENIQTIPLKPEVHGKSAQLAALNDPLERKKIKKKVSRKFVPRIIIEN